VLKSSAITLHGWVTRQARAWLSPDMDRTGVGAGAAGRTVLVVDDDRGVLRLTSRMLRMAGYKVLEAGSGPEALAVLRKEPGIDLVLTDIVMPEMHGLELVDRALETAPKLRIVLMTGHALELTAQLGGQQTPLPLLLKPFSADQLLAKVREALIDEGH
jgi:two-component system, cell cycle sensor histidine kinase and response regulator CckA